MKLSQLECPKCGAFMVLRDSKFGKFYGCSKFYIEGCAGRISAKQDGSPRKPKQSYSERKAREEAEKYFKMLWESGKYSQQDSFDWMCARMKLERYEAYIPTFSEAKCKVLVSKVKEELGLK